MDNLCANLRPISSKKIAKNYKSIINNCQIKLIILYLVLLSFIFVLISQTFNILTFELVKLKIINI